MDDADPSETDALVAELAGRAALLDALTDGAATTGELERRIDCSRSTVHRATESLRDRGAVTRVDEGFALTGFGRALARETDRYRRRVATAAALEPLLDALPTDAPEIPLDAFVDASTTEPDGRRLHVSLRRLRELVEGADRVRLLSSVISPVYVDLLSEAVLDGVDVAAVFDPAVVEIVFEEHARPVREAADAGAFEVRVGDDCPFELFVFDDRMALAAHDDDGHLQAFVEAGDPDAYEWAERLFERYRDAADPATVV
jgi:predicted transcriptional regulator